MKHKYGIGFFAVIIILAAFVTCAYQVSYRHAREKLEAELTARQEHENAKTEASVAADGHALKEDCYYLMEQNGYVVVYLSDKETVYEYTDIPSEELPSSVREELLNGKYIESQEALYGFLENYSS